VNIIKYTVEYFYKGSILSKMEDYARETGPFMTAQVLVRAYYFFLLYVSILFFAPLDLSIGSQTEISYILPIAWLRYVDFPVGMIIIRLLFIIAGVLAAVAPQNRIVRIFSFVMLLQFVSLYFSVLMLDVDWYTTLLVSFVLIFLPDKWGNPNLFSAISRQKFLLVFWGCQAIVALTYSMAGIGKLVGGIRQFLLGQSFIFQPNAPALHIADRLLATGSTSPLGPWAVDHYIFVWPFFVGVVYLLLFSFPAVFRPNIHRVWGLGLILFHIGNFVFINIGFSAHIYLISLIFLASPFVPATVSWREMAGDLPVIGLVLKRL
jgi:hypothetical protein